MMKAINPDAGAERMAAVWILEELFVPADFGTRDIVAQAVRLEAKRCGDMEQAAKMILHAAQQAQRQGSVITRWWFSDQKYRPEAQRPGKYVSNPGAENQHLPSEAEAYAMWQGMSAEYKKANPWHGGAM